MILKPEADGPRTVERSGVRFTGYPPIIRFRAKYAFMTGFSASQIRKKSRKEKLKNCPVEPSLIDAAPGMHYQFERIGYFCVDQKDATPDALVFNQTVSLRDSWAKIAQKAG